jgi:hypothetical protein
LKFFITIKILAFIYFSKKKVSVWEWIYSTAMWASDFAKRFKAISAFDSSPI